MNRNRKILLNSEEIFATTALAIFLDEVEDGWDALNWLPETVNRTIEKIYGDLPLTTLNKLNAALFLVNPETAEKFYTDLDKFVILCNTLSKGTTEDLIADTMEICWAITEA